jgi:S1-C subfamily serine protease
MRKLTATICLTLAVFPLSLMGCVGPLVEEIEVDGQLAENLRKDIPVFTTSQLSGRAYQVVGQFQATSCYNNFILDTPATKDKALDQVRLKANNVGADGLLGALCGSMKGTSLATNCWYSYTCQAAAIRFEKSRQKTSAEDPSDKNSNKQERPPSASIGSGFFVSKLGHIVTNEHVVRKCGSVTVGDNANKQVKASVLETDKRNDLALLRISSTQMASVETKSLISKLGLKLVPLASEGLFKSDDVELGEDVLVAGYPYGDIFSNSIKVTKGIISSNIGMGDDRGQFQMDAAVQPGNSGGPIYDENGNIVGVVISQLNKLKVAKAIGSLPENVNFGIKASTVRQFLTSAGLPTKWSNRTERKSTKELAQIAKNQTVMVVCNP